MPGSTARLALPYPIPDDTVDVPRDVQALAAKLDPGAALFVQGTDAARPAAGVPGRFYFAADRDQLHYDDGATWTPLTVPGGMPPFANALPASPVYGQEVYYRNPSTPYVMWHLRWTNEWGDAYPWDYLGGAALTNAVDAASTRVGNTYGPMADGAYPQVNIPRAGYYDVSFGAYIRASGAAGTGVFVCPTGAGLVYADGLAAQFDAPAVNYGAAVSRTLWGKLLTPGVMQLYYRNSTATTTTATGRWLTVTPTRVG